MSNPQQLHAGQPELSRTRRFQNIVVVKPERIPRSNKAWCELRKAGELGIMGCKGVMASPAALAASSRGRGPARRLQSSALESASRRGRGFRRRARSHGVLARSSSLHVSAPRCSLCCAVCPAPWAPPPRASEPPSRPHRFGIYCSPRPGHASGPSVCSAYELARLGALAYCSPQFPARAAVALCTRKVRFAHPIRSTGTQLRTDPRDRRLPFSRLGNVAYQSP